MTPKHGFSLLPEGDKRLVSVFCLDHSLIRCILRPLAQRTALDRRQSSLDRNRPALTYLPGQLHRLAQHLFPRRTLLLQVLLGNFN